MTTSPDTEPFTPDDLETGELTILVAAAVGAFASTEYVAAVTDPDDEIQMSFQESAELLHRLLGRYLGVTS